MGWVDHMPLGAQDTTSSDLPYSRDSTPDSCRSRPSHPSRIIRRPPLEGLVGRSHLGISACRAPRRDGKGICMRSLQPVRGTQDLLPDAARRHRHVAETARATAELYGFAEIATPIFEFTEVFSRPIGETSDIVAKEMYSFIDRGGEEITLRPENTAGVVRAVLSDGLLQSVPLKFFYAGPMFRYERPQKGRFRQFHQIGVELIGVAQPQADIEVIALGSSCPRCARNRRARRARAEHAWRPGQPRRLSRSARLLFLQARIRAVGRQPAAART